MCTLAFWGHARRNAQMGRDYTLFNPDCFCLGSRTTSGVKHLLNHCVLERAKRALALQLPSLPYCIPVLTPFPPLFSSAFSIPCSIFRKRWEDLRWEELEYQQDGRRKEREISWDGRVAAKRSLWWFPSLYAALSGG